MKEGRALKTLIPALTYAAAALFASLPAAAQKSSESYADELAELRDEVEELSRYAVRSQAHVMMDVEYHFANLWFAAHEDQWDLAAFYMREARSHIGWAVRMRPVRPVQGGGEVDLRPMQQALEAGGMTQLSAALERRDVEAFEAAYRQTLVQCNACHQAAGRGYLNVKIPTSPPARMVLGAAPSAR
ncbi:MAG TPA: hypothetical protein VF322_04785 [Gammaproteobacteria bacterium]